MTGAAGEPIRWGSGPLAFELETADPEIRDAAHRVFNRWRPDEDAVTHGRWSAYRDEGELVVSPRRPPDAGAQLDTIRDPEHAVAIIEYAAIAQIVERCDHILSFHAALLSKNGKSIALVGPSHSGKSTLATGLWQSGWRFHCDDLTMIIDGKAVAGPRRVALRSEARPHVGEDLWNRVPSTHGYFKTAVGCLFQPMHLDGTMPERVDLNGIFFMKRNGAPQDKPFNRLERAHAALALLPYTNLVRTRPFSEALAPVAALMDRAPAWDLPRRPLPEMIATVESLTGHR
ncbi:MAG TPA: hypothetical protein VF042_14345 [Gemmatimonadaceae bacterium]